MIITCARCKEKAHTSNTTKVKSGHIICSDCFSFLKAKQEEKSTYVMPKSTNKFTDICPHCNTYCYGDCKA